MLVPWEQLIPPLLAGGISVGLSLLLALPRQLPRWAAGLPAAAVLLAAGLGMLRLIGWHVPVTSMEQLLPLQTLLAALVLAIAGGVYSGWPPRITAVLIAVLAASGCSRMAFHLADPPAPPLLLGLGCGLLTGLFAWTAEMGMARLSPFLMRLVVGIAGGGAAAALAGSGTANYGVSAGCLAAAAGLPVLWSRWRCPSAGVAAALLSALSYCFLITGLLAADLPHAAWMVLLPPALACGVGLSAGNLLRLPALARRPRLGAALVVALALVAAGAGLAWIALFGQPVQDDGMG